MYALDMFQEVIMKTVSILGSTGSIGKQTLDVCKMHNIKVKALAAHSNIKLLAEQAREFKVKTVCIYNELLYNELKQLLSDTETNILVGINGLCEIASDNSIDILVNAVVGMVGLLPTLTAIESGVDIALANKETLVAGGSLVMSQAKKHGVKIYPIDSEHSAVFQCLQGCKAKYLNKIILTASGGPFFGKTKNELKNVKVEQALCHPNWSMGKKITIDSATLMNKGLEFIEAKWLFNLTPEQIEIVVHRESVIHSAVEFKDYSIIAQLGVPDMKIPIQYALLYPERVACPTKQLSLTDYGALSFYKPDFETFDCLSACIKACTKGGAYPCIANGANEEAVRLFLDEKISFLEIGELVSEAVDYFENMPVMSYENITEADKLARKYVTDKVR